MPYSILIHADRATHALSACLESVAFSDDVQVIEAAGDERLREIATGFGARMLGAQARKILKPGHANNESPSFRHPWVLLLDATDRVPKGLAAELQLMECHSGDQLSYRIARRVFIDGRRVARWLGPRHQARLVHRDLLCGGLHRMPKSRTGELEAWLRTEIRPAGIHGWITLLRANRAPGNAGCWLPNALRWMAAAACVLLVALVFFCSWLPQPQLGPQVPMPNSLAAWVDAAANENLRTAVPFVLLGLAGGLGMLPSERRIRTWALAWLAMVGVAVVAELGQQFLPGRCCDSGDIGWAAIGAAAGLVISRLAGSILITTPARPQGIPLQEPDPEIDATVAELGDF